MVDRCIDDLTEQELALLNRVISELDKLKDDWGKSSLESPYSDYVYHSLLQDYLRPISHSVINNPLPNEEITDRLVKGTACIIEWLCKREGQDG